MSMKRNNTKNTFIRGFLTFCILSTLLVSIAVYIVAKKKIESDMANIQTIYSVRLEASLDQVFHQTDVLKTVVEINQGEFSEEDFNRIAVSIYEQTDGIRAVQYLPEGVVVYCYPIEGNEAAIGGNVFENPKRRADAQMAVDTKSIALSGPYELTQGGIGCVARNPIFLTDDDGNEYFWGFAVLVLDVEESIEAMGLSQLNKQGYDFQLYHINENGDYMVIAGNTEMDLNGATKSTIQVPNHQWTLALRPNHPYQGIFLAVITAVIGLLITALFAYAYKLSLLRAETEAQDRFLSNMSHNMRTPMNAIIGLTQLALDHTENSEAKEYLASAKKSADYLLYLINFVLDLRQIKNEKITLKPSWVPLTDVFVPCVETIQQAMDEKKIIFTTPMLSEYGVCECYIDLEKTQHMLMNLLYNAYGSTPENGKVKLSIQTVQQNDQSATTKIIIEDSGCGMSNAAMKKSHTPFTPDEGYDVEVTQDTSLGLALCRQTAEAMGSSIIVENKPGMGSRFTVALSYRCRMPISENSACFSLSGRHILVCEDNHLNTMVAKKLLEREGMLVDTAENGQIGVDKFQESITGYYSAVIMDIRMPIMDGLEAAKAIRVLDRPDAARVVIIAMSANAYPEDVQASLNAGMNAHLSKPVNPPKLYKTLKEQILRYCKHT